MKILFTGTRDLLEKLSYKAKGMGFTRMAYMRMVLMDAVKDVELPKEEAK